VRQTIAALLFGCVTFASCAALAGSDDDAKDLFARGRELRKKGDCAAAIPLFRNAYRLMPSGLGSLRNAAECEESLGRFASSRRDWLELQRALLVVKDKKYDTFDEDAKNAVARLASKVPHVKIEIATKEKSLAKEDLASLKVTFDGEPIETALIGTLLDRDPGKHRVKVEGGVEPIEQDVELAVGDDKTVRVVIELPKPKEPEKTVPKEPPVELEKPKEKAKPNVDPIVKDDGKNSSSTMRMVGWTSIAVGGAAAAATIVSFAVRASALSDVDASCPSRVHCAPSVQSAVDRGHTASVLVNVFGIGALAFSGIGVGLLLANPAPPTHTTVRFAPFASASSTGLAVFGAF